MLFYLFIIISYLLIYTNIIHMMIRKNKINSLVEDYWEFYGENGTYANIFYYIVLLLPVDLMKLILAL